MDNRWRDMKFKPQDSNSLPVEIAAPQPTIWALRRNVRDAGQDNAETSTDISGSLYEHLFGYDPIRVLGRNQPPAKTETPNISADNPNLNIINSQTNFLVMELASDDVTKP